VRLADPPQLLEDDSVAAAENGVERVDDADVEAWAAAQRIVARAATQDVRTRASVQHISRAEEIRNEVPSPYGAELSNIEVDQNIVVYVDLTTGDYFTSKAFTWPG
jgi:hypothetical protein